MSTKLCEIIDDYTVIDLETTGRSIHSDIIELAAVKVRNCAIVDKFSMLVNPGVPLQQIITDVTGITNSMLIGASDISKALPLFLDFVGDDIVLGHNINSFDMHIINDKCCEYLGISFDNDALDTLTFSRHCQINVENRKLTTLSTYFGIKHEAHRALGDCIANFECYEALKPYFDEEFYEQNSKSSSHHNKTKYTEETKALQTLTGIIKGILCDNVLSNDEILYLRKWLSENSQLSGNFPFDVITETITNVLADGIITANEREYLISILNEYADPISNCSVDANETISLYDKNVCLTGDFINGSRAEMTTHLSLLGAIVKSGVTSKTDYVIVGGNGSDQWACGNYGTKVKKALELQSKGSNIQIIREEDLIKCLK